MGQLLPTLQEIPNVVMVLEPPAPEKALKVAMVLEPPTPEKTLKAGMAGFLLAPVNVYLVEMGVPNCNQLLK